MWRLRNVSVAVLGLFLCCTSSVFAEVAVGEATLIKTEVTGENGPLVVKAPVHRDERIRTSIGGLGQFVFRDGTKLAVGAGSSVVIDSYVYDDQNSVKKLTIKAAKGTFRWISGNSSSSAYSIVTPAGTIGVRGTAFDVYVAPNGTTAMVLLNGSAQFCGAGGCKQLRQQCDCVIASRGGGVSDPGPVDETTLRRLGNQKALPFLSGNQQLSGPLGNIRTSCGLRSIRLDRRDPIRDNAPDVAPAPQKQDPAPQRQAPQREPERPQKPDKAHHHDKHDHHGWGHFHDRDDNHWGGRDWGGRRDGRHDGWNGNGDGRSGNRAGWGGQRARQDGGWGQRSGGRDGAAHRRDRQQQEAGLGNGRHGPDGDRGGRERGRQRGPDGGDHADRGHMNSDRGNTDGPNAGGARTGRPTTDRGSMDRANRGHANRDQGDRGAGRRGDRHGSHENQQNNSSPATNFGASDASAGAAPANAGTSDVGSTDATSGGNGSDGGQNGGRHRGGSRGDGGRGGGGERSHNHDRFGR
jgi:hypothetical protein